MSRRCSKNEWDDAVARLTERVTLHPDVQVTYERKPLTEEDGYCEIKDPTGRFAIVVDSRLSQRETVDTLIHELAHVLDWSHVHGHTQDHGPTWGVRYAYVYRRYHGVE